ncbi:ABC transporter ATP-binding protein [Paenibacillus swuensis]|uniref:ABC transporter ATP-binding protein n=1 Tax=Paenibacillus swuensis TaxID=1178515 RepID=UPI002F90E709
MQIRNAGYAYNQHIIHDIEFSVKPGELVGLIGVNGAGKSTTIRAILGLLEYSDADIRFGSKDSAGAKYSYIPEQPILYDGLTLWEHLELAAAAYGLEESRFHQQAEALLIRFRLNDARHHLPQSFSKGMQQKLMLIISMLIQPDYYIIDEPFIGLDPFATRDFLEFLIGERSRGAGILMSTHVLDTAEKICDSFLVIHQGKLTAQGDLRKLRRLSGVTANESLFECFLQMVSFDGNRRNALAATDT